MKSKKTKIPSQEERASLLTQLRHLKMAQSSQAYVRGNTEKFYEWLKTSNGRAVPQGPAMWICGDCHLGNLGPLANAKGGVDIEIRDLDQTVIGNPAHDLIRLGLSLASAARGSDLPGVMTAIMLEQMMEGYKEAFVSKKPKKKKGKEPEAVKIAMKDALRRKWKHMAEDRIKDAEPNIPLGKRFWRLSKEEKNAIKELFATEAVRKLVTKLRSRDDDAEIEVLDAAYWVKGCSSLGNLRYAVIVRVGGKKGDLCLIDIKEAISAFAPAYAKTKIPKDNAERVVKGAKHLSPALGERMLAAELNGHSVFLRELLPQDLKLEIDQLTQEEAIRASRFLANVVGKAHARQMKASERKHWQAELIRNRSKTLDAPSWLWSSVVELVASHEEAYLNHCRRYATS